MTRFDFTPLFRSTIGFDRLARVLESTLESDTNVSGYPPYNIESTGDNAYRLTMAVAGFGKDEITIESRENQLIVAGRKTAEEENRAYLHRGIAGRDFVRRFQLADHVKAVGADLANGLLHIDLVRELPEAMKPRRIEIKSEGAIEDDARKPMTERNKQAA